MPPLLAVAHRRWGSGASWARSTALLVAYGRVPAIIVTLGTLAIYRVVLVEFSGAKTVTTADSARLAERPARSATVASIGDFDLRVDVRGASLVVVVLLPAGAALPALRPAALRHRLEPGRGRAWPACRHRRVVFTAFALCGALSGLAGFMFLARFGNITVTAGRGLELQVVAAVVVGGVNIFGGSGTDDRRAARGAC